MFTFRLTLTTTDACDDVHDYDDDYVPKDKNPYSAAGSYDRDHTA